MPPFVHEDKNPGDLIRSKDWNLLGNEVLRLGADKISRVGEESLDGPLTVRGALAVGAGSAGGGLTVKGELAVGTTGAGAAVRVLRRQEDGKDATHGALVLGTDSAASAALRVGYYSTYSWLQGQGQQNIAINPFGGNVGIGTAATPAAKLHVEGDLRVTGALSFGNVTRQMVNLWAAEYGLGVQNATTYLRTGGHFGFYRGGAHSDTLLDAGGGSLLMALRSTGDVGIGIADPKARLHVAGGTLRLDSGQEIYFADNGQIRSLDNAHRILFRRSENKLELREFGDIVFSPGAKDGSETAKAVLNAAGQLYMGTTAPVGGHPLYIEGGEVYSGGTGGGFSFGNRGSAYTSGGGTGDRWVLYSHDHIARLWSGNDKLTVTADGMVTAGTFRFGNNSVLKGDQGGSIELGGDNETAGTGTPYIDFHYQGKKKDYNARIINDGEAKLSVVGTGAVVLECYDLFMGHSSRRGSVGRALVDGGKTLVINYGADWSGGVQHGGALSQWSTREIKRDIVTLDEPRAHEILAGLEPVSYRLIVDEDGWEQLGFIAEDVPDAIAGSDQRTITPMHIIAVLTRVAKTQQRRLDELTHRLEEGLSA